MSATIDERIVQMKFDNKDFENNVQTSLGTLGRLKEALKFDNATSSLNALSQATEKIDFNPVTDGIEALEKRFSTLGIVGMTVIQNLTNTALNFATTWVSKIPSMIAQGGWTRAMNIENAHFQLQGLIDDEKEVKAVMEQASESVNGTAYSYDSAAKAASMFAATGLKSGKEMENALKGIAGVAATTNADYESISNVFTTIAGNGRVMGEQLNQLSYRGMNAAAALTKYFNGVRNGSIEASESVKNTINSIMGSQSSIVQSAEEVKKALESQYEAAQKAYNEEYKARQKALSKEYKAYQKSLNEEYELKKEAYQKEYDALQDALDAEINAQKESNSKRIEAANNSYNKDVENYRKATEAKIALIDQEYAESLKLIDEEAYNRLKAIDDEINGINAQAEAEEKARKQEERAAKLASLQQAVSSAKTITAKQKAEQALAEYNKKIAEEELAEQRKARIAELQEQKTAINEEADLKRQAAKDKRDAAIDSVQNEYNSTISEMQKKHEEEMEVLQNSLNEQLQAMVDSRNERLTSMKKSQSDELEVFREGQNEQLEAYKEGQDAQLEALRESQNEKLKVLKASITEQEKATSKFSSSMELTEADIRDMVSKGLISFDVFSEAMATTFGDHAKDANKTFTGALSNIRAALARTGAMFYSDLIVQEGEAVKLFNEIREKINAMNEVLAPFAADTSEAINGFIRKLALMVSKIPIKEITTAATNMARSLANAFKFIGSAIKPVISAFVGNFKFDVSGVVDFSNRLLDLTKNLNITGNNIARIFKITDVLIKVFKNVGSLAITFGKSFASAFGGISISFEGLEKIVDNITKRIRKFNDEFLKSEDTQKAVASAGEAVGKVFKFIFDTLGAGVTSVIDFVKHSKSLKKIFTNLRDILGKLASKLGDFFGKLTGNINGMDTNKLDDLRQKLSFLEPPLTFIKKIGGKVAEAIGDILESINKSMDVDVSGFDIMSAAMEKLRGPVEFLRDVGIVVFDALKNVLGHLVKALKDTGAEIWNILSGANPLESLIVYINTKLLTGMGKAIFDLLDTITKGLLDVAIATLTNFVAQLTTLFGSLRGLEAFANAMKTMAEAILMLAGACLILQAIDAAGLTKASTAIGVLLSELTGAYIAMRRLSGPSSPLVSGSLKDGIFSYGTTANFGKTVLEMAAAIGILTGACYALSKMDLKSLEKGIGAVSALLWELAGVAVVMSRGGGDKTVGKVASSLIGMSIAIVILVKAVKELSQLDMESLFKGVGAVSALIFVLGAFVRIVGGAEKITGIGVGLILVSAAVKILTSSVGELAKLDTEALLQGTLAVAGLILVLGVFTKLAGGSEKLISIGFGLLEVSAAVYILSQAIKELSAVDAESLVASVSALGAVLFEIGILLYGIEDGAIGKAFAILEVSAAIVLIGKTLTEMNGLDIEGLVASVAALGGIMFMIGIMLYAVPEGSIGKGFAAIEMAAAIVLIGMTLVAMNKLDVRNLAASVAALVAVLGTITLCLMGIPPEAVLGGLAAIEMAASTVIIAVSLKILSTIPGERILDCTLALVGALGAIALCLVAIPPTAVLGGLAAIEMAAAMVIIAVALKQIASIDADDLAKALLGFIGAISLLEAAMVAIGAIGPIAIAGAGIMFVMATSLAGSALVLAPALMAIADAIEYWSKIDNEKFGTSIEHIGEAIGVFGKALKNYNILAKGSAQALKTTAEALNVLAPAMMMFMLIDGPKLKKSFNTVGDGIATFGTSLKKFGLFSEVGAVALVTVAEALKVMAPALIMLSLADPKRLASEMETLGYGFGKFGEALKSYDIFSGIGADALVTLAEAIKILAPSLAMLSIIDPERTSAILTSIGEAFKLFGEALDATPFWGSKSRAEGITYLTEDVKLLADSLPALTRLDGEKVKNVLSAIGSAFKDFGTALDNAPFWAPKNRGEAIGVLVQEIQDLANVLPAFMGLDAESARVALTTIGDAFASFGNALGEAPFWAPKNRGKAITILVGSISELSDGLVAFTSANFEAGDVRRAITQIASAFSKFGKSLKEAPFWNPENKGAAIATLVGSVKNLAVGLEYFINKVDAEKVDGAITSIGKAFKDFAAALKGTPWFNIQSRSQGIVALVSSIKNLADGVGQFVNATEGKTDIATNALAQIGQSLIDFGTAIKKTPFWGTNKRADALINVVDELGVIADVVARLANIGSGEEVAAYMNAMTSGIGTLATDISGFKGIGKDTMEKFGSCLAIATSMAEVNTSSFSACINQFNRIPKMIEGLGGIDFAVLDAVRRQLTSFVTSSTLIMTQISIFVRTCLQVLAKAESQFQNQGKNMALSVITGMNTISPRFQMTATMFAISFNTMLLSQLSLLRKTGTMLTASVLTGMDTNKMKFNLQGMQYSMLLNTSFISHTAILRSTGTLMSTSVLSGLESRRQLFSSVGRESAMAYVYQLNAAVGLSNMAARSMALAASNAIHSTVNHFRAAGVQAGHGFANGLESTVRQAYRAGWELGNAAYEAARRALDEHSPSKKMDEVGNFAGIGFVKALKLYISDAQDTGEELGESTLYGLKRAITKNMDIPNLTDPVIKPTLDLSDVKNGTDMLNSMLNSERSIGLASGINLDVNKANIMGDLVGSLVDSTSTGDEMIFGALQDLRGDLSSLQRVVGNLKVYMDTGTLVGEIAPGMDNALGQMAMLQRRGV